MAVAGLAIAFVWISIWFRFRDAAPEPPPAPPDVRLWDYLGCHHLQFDAWVPDDDGDAGPAGAPADPPVVRSLMLFPDSVDEFGREMETYRAIPLEADGSLTGLDARWFTRADTLWLVWSSDEVRGAVALRQGRTGMLGRAVARLRGQAAANAGGGGSVQAPVSAWPVNCHSLRPDRITPVDR